MREINLKGKKFGFLLVLGKAKQTNVKAGILWECKCDCGNIKNVRSYQLHKGITKSCGCLRGIKLSKSRTTHGLTSSSPFYCTWAKMKARCFSEKNRSYKHYGGRGITMCDEWRDDFMTFHNWCISSGYKKGLSIDRIDNNGNYEPDNCRWSTQKEQQRNRRSNRLVTYKGESKPISEWCDILGINYH